MPKVSHRTQGQAQRPTPIRATVDPISGPGRPNQRVMSMLVTMFTAAAAVTTGITRRIIPVAVKHQHQSDCVPSSTAFSTASVVTRSPPYIPGPSQIRTKARL